MGRIHVKKKWLMTRHLEKNHMGPFLHWSSLSKLRKHFGDTLLKGGGGLFFSTYTIFTHSVFAYHSLIHCAPIHKRPFSKRAVRKACRCNILWTVVWIPFKFDMIDLHTFGHCMSKFKRFFLRKLTFEVTTSVLFFDDLPGYIMGCF